ASGNLLAMNEVRTVTAKQWKTDKGESIIPALNVVLGKKLIISDLWNQGGDMMKIGVAPVIDPDAPVSAQDPDGQVIIGAIVVAYAQTAKLAQQDRNLLGTEIAYYDNRNVMATSFTTAAGAEDTAKAHALTELLHSGTLTEGGAKQKIAVDGAEYLAAAVKMPRSSTRRLPADYPPVTAGAVVLAPVADPSNLAGTVKLFILLLGGGALAIALVGLYLSHRRLIAQVDQIELGVTDIINGNVDRTFRPVGQELDGLANGLNVMLARLLGRPEPGEEEFDDEGNPILQGRVEFEDGDGAGTGAAPAADLDLAALAQESEPDYYKRVYTEYLAARRSTGNPDEVSFENFIAKLKVNEGKLKAQYQCRAVRFRVVVNDGKVTLKPVPIFA
ncbi:MAG TPA: MXAN_5187 C-terminal domain-containing protein, partial [Kofleriaceae bacterium]